MCGRTACTLNRCQLQRACGFVDNDGVFHPAVWNGGNNQSSSDSYIPSYNIAPSTNVPVLISSKNVDLSEKKSHESVRLLRLMRWGLIPSWYHDDPSKFKFKMNNCRNESMLSKQTFNSPLHKGRRCVMVADGFYEWKTYGKNKKQPYFIHFPQIKTIDWSDEHDKDNDTSKPWNGRRLLTMAGIFDVTTLKETNEELYSVSVITVPSASSINWIHHRMPAILDGDDEVNAWLDYTNVDVPMACSLIKSFNGLSYHAVNPAMGNVFHRTDECILPYEISSPYASPKKSDATKLTQKSLSSFFKPNTRSGKRKHEGDDSMGVKSSPVKKFENV